MSEDILDETCADCSIEYYTDCSIRVSRSFVKFLKSDPAQTGPAGMFATALLSAPVTAIPYF